MERLWNRHFALLWQGQVVSLLGAQAYLIASVLWLKHATESATAVGLLSTLSLIPAILLGPLGGVFADRWSRKRIIVGTDLLRGASALALAAFMVSELGDRDLRVLAVFATSVSIATLGAFFTPAVTAAVPDLVPARRLTGANSWIESTRQAATFVGFGVGGVLFQLLGAPLLFAANGFCYLLSGLSESFIRFPERAARALERSLLTELREGFGYVWGTAGLRRLVVTFAAFQFVVWGPVIVLMPFYVEDTLSLAPRWFGFLVSGFGAGSMAGYVIAGALQLRPEQRSMLYLLSVALEALGFTALGLTRSPYAALALVASIGMLQGFHNILFLTLMQRTTPPELRGRVVGFVFTIVASVQPISMGLAGIIADALDRNIPVIFVASGLSGAVLALLLFERGTRRFLAS